MAKNEITVRMHFSETKTWQRARDIYAQALQELSAIDDLESEMMRHRVLRHLLKVCNCLAQAMNALKHDQKRHYYHSAIGACLDVQSEIHIAAYTQFFDLSSLNEDLNILIRQIGANINFLNTHRTGTHKKAQPVEESAEITETAVDKSQDN